MKFVECGVDELGKLKKYADNYGLLMKFIESGLPAARVEDYPQRKAEHCYTSLNASIRRYGFNQVKVSIRSGNVYLIRKDI